MAAQIGKSEDDEELDERSDGVAAAEAGGGRREYQAIAASAFVSPSLVAVLQLLKLFM